MAALHLVLFGPPRVELDGVQVSLARRKSQALLAYLALSPTGQSRDFLAALLWPERDGASARADLRTGLFAVRRAIGGEWLEIEGEHVALRRTPDLDVDVLRFRDLLAQAAAHRDDSDESGRATALAEAVALYAGDFLAGFSLPDALEFDDWQTYQTEALRLQVAQALEQLVALLNARGNIAGALGYARRWLELDPLCEEPHRVLMQLYARAGNRASALRQYDECARILDEELGVKPDAETTALYTALAGGQSVVAGRILPQPLVLPPDHTPFIGRETELAELAARLSDPACRLLTVLGPGGSGKTRLAVQAARAQAGSYSGGIFFVDLQPLETAGQLAAAMLRALKASPSGAEDPAESLIAFLRGRELLLLLDNFEHLVDGAGLLARLLDAAPGLKLLVTSRARLALSMEWLLPLDGMELPPVTARRVALEDYSATALFLACASRLRPDYAPAASEAAEIVRVCRLLEGMPLGIELAAARARLMPVRDIAAELARGLDVLATTLRDAPARHRSMAAAFDASWRLLAPRERSILRQLAIFRGGFTAEAAGAVTGATVHDLAQLVDSCWLRAEPHGRLGMHELIRQYCEAKLRVEHRGESGEGETEVKARHVGYFRYFVLEKHAAFQVRPAALPEIEREFGNLIAAWEGLSDPSDLALMRQVTAGFDLMVERLVWWPVVMPLIEQNIRRFRAALVQGDGDSESGRRLELAIAWHIFLLTKGKQMMGRYGDSGAYLDEAEVLLGKGDPEDLGWGQTHYMIVRNRTWLNYLMGRRAAAERSWLEMLAQLRAARGPIWVFPPHSSLPAQAEALLGLGWNALEDGRSEQGLMWAREAVEMAEEFGSPAYEAMMRSVLIAALTATGDHRQAERVAKQALRLAHSAHATDIVIQCLPPLVALYRAMGRPAQVRIWGRRCVALCEETGYCESGLPWVLMNLSWAELELDHVVEARRYARRSLKLVEQAGGADNSPYADAAITVGRVALVEGEPETAANWFQRALASRAKRAGAAVSAARMLADIRRAQGRPAEAVELLAMAERSARSDRAAQQSIAAALRELESELTPEVHAAAVARGAILEL